MTTPAIISAFAAKDFDVLRAALVGELVPVIPSNVDPQTWDPRELGSSGGNKFQAVIWQERLWFRDEDSVAARDEITCIVLADGCGYLTNDIRMPRAVMDRDLTTPPDEDDDPPVAFGDAYLVPAGGSGEWATHEDEVAIWTARGWRYKVPAVGDLLYVRDELGYIHYSEDEAWEDGIGAYALGDGAVRPNHLLIRAWTAENQSTTAPPANGPAGETYIIGASATGAWSGHDKKIAFRPALNAAFVIVAPFVSEEVFDKALGGKFKWNGTVWLPAAGAIVAAPAATFTAGAGDTAVIGTGSDYSYHNTTAPTTSNKRIVDGRPIEHQAQSSSSRLKFKYQASLSEADAGTALVSCMLLRNSEVTAIAWAAAPMASGEITTKTFDFEVAAPDAALNTYTIAFTLTDAGGTGPTALGRRHFSVMEVV